MNPQELCKKITFVQEVLTNAQKTLEETYIPTYAVIEYIKELTALDMENLK